VKFVEVLFVKCKFNQISGEKCFFFLKLKGKTNKTNKKKEKMESGVAYNPLITKRKTFSFGRFTK
jgi:hypothetical protein